MNEVNRVLRVSLNGKKKAYRETTDKTNGYPIIDSQFDEDDGDHMAEVFQEQVLDTFKNFNIKGGVFIGLAADGRPCLCSCVNNLTEAKTVAYNTGKAVARNAILEARSSENYQPLINLILESTNMLNAGCVAGVDEHERQYLAATINHINKEK